jgi:hypothetical protein
LLASVQNDYKNREMVIFESALNHAVAAVDHNFDVLRPSLTGGKNRRISHALCQPMLKKNATILFKGFQDYKTQRRRHS